MISLISILLIVNGLLVSVKGQNPNYDANNSPWEVIGESPVVCIHSMLLPNNKLLCIERPREFPYAQNSNSDGRTVSEIQLGDEDLGIKSVYHIQSPEIFENAFCGHHSQMANGSIFVVGGDQRELFEASNGTILIHDTLVDPQVNPDISDYNGKMFLIDGAKGRRIFNPCKQDDDSCEGGEWVQLPNMTTERWYPTALTLADGSFIILSGSFRNLDLENHDGNNNPTYEYWPEREGNWPKQLNALTWAFPFSLYPQAYVLPDGKVFVLVSNRTIVIDPENDNDSDQPPTVYSDLSIENHAPWLYPFMPASAVMPLTKKNNWEYKLMFCGGSEALSSSYVRTSNIGNAGDAGNSRPNASKACVQFNPKADNNQNWERIEDMPHGRLMADNVLLPDGKILYLNGAGWGYAGGNGGQAQYATDPVFAPDLFDPDAPIGQRWQTLEEASVARLYHSGALLIESGHVIATGSEMQNYVDFWPTPDPNCWPASNTPCTLPFETRIERFTPPYLRSKSEDDRLKIDSIEKSVISYESIFRISSNKNSDNIDRVTATRYGTATHQLNLDQRFYELDIIKRKDNDIYVSAPTNSSMAPPGNWFIWLLDSDGTPSRAKTVQFAFGDVTDSSKTNGALSNSYGKLTIISIVLTIFINQVFNLV